MIAGLLLAAGRSVRFGGDKLLAQLCGRRVVRWSVESLAANVDVIYAVVPPGAHELIRALGGINVVFVEHLGRDQGLASSIGAGVAALSDDVEAVLIALGDQPLVSSVIGSRLVAAWRARHARAVAPKYRDRVGHPVLLDRRCFAQLSALTGDQGARTLLDSLGSELELVRVDENAPADVDTREALRVLETATACREL